MTTIDPIYIGTDALDKLVRYCENKHLNRFTLIADTNTYRALGERVESTLKAKGCEDEHCSDRRGDNR
jgi:glycerol dehydrogenase-like iron-containing ADH family enzyme